MDWFDAPDIKKEIGLLVKNLEFIHIDPKRIICFRSHGSTSRARARIWSFPRIWQQALKLPACYVIEVLSKHFDHLSYDDRRRVLIHELLHIPKNFSGSLVPHKGRYARIDTRRVEGLFKILSGKNL
ncbi:hypothetical protein A3D03_05395 [Candidatus Gottesmanbacteria bacterium RIFCSPHIGHO2_02_FULL_40_13]|uniref:Putative phage metallopeptidase domain-containing protein n=1 Tax=Candidatus Gottesmanbacteria bacterium RIFCSPHIGHO2_02_FULL_40_13 TaxID=1798384 RepID=A0A1F6A7U8_9BACT|nr:MAG: hypothetical protein A3D03_05395 [Candidatus Gottesmanbacteria bacterium RIFCSPHIGHO2_02_FULL_40_13]